MGIAAGREREPRPVGELLRIYDFEADGDWAQESRAKYVNLRTQPAAPLGMITLAADTGFDTAFIENAISSATTPVRGAGNFDVVRSDFGEVLSYMILEEVHSTKFGYLSVRDRETIQLTGRGIDAIGVEETDPLTLVLCETKVSDEDRTPPQVVDSTGDSLRGQHDSHVADLAGATALKVFDAARRARDPHTRNLMTAAALFLQEAEFNRIALVLVCFLVRPADRTSEEDVGSFGDNVASLAPGRVRFIIATVAGRIDVVVNDWSDCIGGGSGGDHAH